MTAPRGSGPVGVRHADVLRDGLQTARLVLRPFAAADLEAAVRGDDVLAAHLGVPVEPGWMDFPEALPFFIDVLRAWPERAVWAMYGCFFGSERRLVGGAGFKGGPTAEETVEIGYGIAPAFRGRGLAVEAARGLVAFAFDHADVRAVLAHTIPAEGASTAVLTSAGITHAGTVVDPDDGPVWRWVLPRPSSL